MKIKYYPDVDVDADEKPDYKIGERRDDTLERNKLEDFDLHDLILTGIWNKPRFIDMVIGREAKKDIKEDEWITWEAI